MQSLLKARQSPRNGHCSVSSHMKILRTCSIPTPSSSGVPQRTNPSVSSSDCFFQARQHTRYATGTAQPFNPSMQYNTCSSNRLKAFISSSGMPPPNIFQARSKTWNQATHLGTSATLKHRAQETTCYQLPNYHFSISLPPLLTDTLDFLKKVEDTTVALLPPQTLSAFSSRYCHAKGGAASFPYTAKSTVLVHSLCKPHQTQS